MQAGSLRGFYISELKKTHDAEKQLIAALPAVIQAASSKELRELFNRHLEQTKDHATRVEMILQALGEGAEGEKCTGMASLISDLEQLSQGLSHDVLDSALVSYAQRIKHFEIATYGSLRDCAAAPPSWSPDCSRPYRRSSDQAGREVRPRGRSGRSDRAGRPAGPPRLPGRWWYRAL